MTTIEVEAAEEIAAVLQEIYERTGLYIEACSCCCGITVHSDADDSQSAYDCHEIRLNYKLDRYIVDANVEES